MTKKDTFLLVSLEDDEARKLGQIINNDTSRKILDFLSDKDATETELSVVLKVPISTIHYNMQALLKAKLIEAEKYHYSKKGKEILHYTLANKYIIIAPKSTHGLKNKLRSILPVAGLIGTAAIFMKYFEKSIKISSDFTAQPMLAAANDLSVQESARFASDTIAPVSTNIVTSSIWQSNITWFLIGSALSLILYLLIEYWRKRK